VCDSEANASKVVDALLVVFVCTLNGNLESNKNHIQILSCLDLRLVDKDSIGFRVGCHCREKFRGTTLNGLLATWKTRYLRYLHRKV
jgi:hypothetical protein